MKKLIYFFLIGLLVTSLVSCEDEDEEAAKDAVKVAIENLASKYNSGDSTALAALFSPTESEVGNAGFTTTAYDNLKSAYGTTIEFSDIKTTISGDSATATATDGNGIGHNFVLVKESDTWKFDTWDSEGTEVLYRK